MEIDMKDFKEAMKTAVEWFQKNCNPHQKIIISGDDVEMVSGEMAFPVEPVD
uniref:Uncharacterized protein n=1 Tax=Siphoviridae sp. ctGfF74 TaxID=2826223 RepID=A0A8S5NKW0_9CAUD|nr:MAG TPA: hypothetical protein [Siphoviridae sp. ctGfF74]DAG85401.1 MAG TPA: hypothetical protein [Caudoviricetes sp.]